MTYFMLSSDHYGGFLSHPWKALPQLCSYSYFSTSMLWYPIRLEALLRPGAMLSLSVSLAPQMECKETWAHCMLIKDSLTKMLSEFGTKNSLFGNKNSNCQRISPKGEIWPEFWGRVKAREGVVPIDSSTLAPPGPEGMEEGIVGSGEKQKQRHRVEMWKVCSKLVANAEGKIRDYGKYN